VLALALGLVLGAALLSSATAALAATPEECIAASDRGQAKRDEGQLLSSRAEFVACAADSCPAMVKRECSRWLAEVDERIPSIVISVKEPSGKDVLNPEVSVDGVRVPVVGAGRAFQLDPGTHVVRASVPGSGPVEETILARERERGRTLILVARPLVTHDDAHAAQPGRKVPLASWLLGGVAVAGGGAFAYFWSSGMSRVSDLRESCSPYCTADQIDDARVPLTTARVALGIGIAAAVGAVAVYLLQPSAARSSRPDTALRVPLAFSF
jgi:hypothetical protein